eukprot:TRINITY_DN7248_c0_g1_i6.p1 TRINITY_DN7248_c0_g1~~TRINITY_DN7248_c0_g1_i6.p1  ORF type:complete len:505 (+),score=124.64 TRINITY_DN7248_c0_g1_i6:150-1664(+)
MAVPIRKISLNGLGPSLDNRTISSVTQEPHPQLSPAKISPVIGTLSSASSMHITTESNISSGRISMPSPALNSLRSLASLSSSTRSYDEESNIHEQITLKMVMPSGVTHEIKASTGQTVQELKKILEVKHQIPCRASSLFYGGKFMLDPLSINDFPGIMRDKGAVITIKISEEEPSPSLAPPAEAARRNSFFLDDKAHDALMPSSSEDEDGDSDSDEESDTETNISVPQNDDKPPVPVVVTTSPVPPRIARVPSINLNIGALATKVVTPAIPAIQMPHIAASSPAVHLALSPPSSNSTITKSVSTPALHQPSVVPHIPTLSPPKLPHVQNNEIYDTSDGSNSPKSISGSQEAYANLHSVNISPVVMRHNPTPHTRSALPTSASHPTLPSPSSSYNMDKQAADDEAQRVSVISVYMSGRPSAQDAYPYPRAAPSPHTVIDVAPTSTTMRGKDTHSGTKKKKKKRSKDRDKASDGEDDDSHADNESDLAPGIQTLDADNRRWCWLL